MPGPKTNEHRPDQAPGTRAVLRYARVSAYKVREVLDLIRNKPVGEARDILRFVERDAALLVGKLLNSAIANATTNDEMIEDELYVSACFADEGSTIKRWRPRARGRATRIRKRTCHITVIVSRLPDDKLRVRRARQPGAADRRRRTAASKRAARKQAEGPVEEAAPTDEAADQVEDTAPVEEVEETAPVEEAPVEEAVSEEAPVEAGAEPESEPEAEPEAAEQEEEK